MPANPAPNIQHLLENPFENYKRLSELFVWSVHSLQPDIRIKPYANISPLQTISPTSWERVIATLFFNMKLLGVNIDDHLRFNEQTRTLEFCDPTFEKTFQISGL